MLHSVEFYVVLTIIAAAVLAFCLRPARKDSVVEISTTGWLVAGDGDGVPRLLIVCNDDGSVTFRRTGLSGMYADGAIGLTIYKRGFDWEIFERRTSPGRCTEEPAYEAVFVLRDIAPDWHHIKYNCDPATRFAAFSLHVRPGIRQSVDLYQ